MAEKSSASKGMRAKSIGHYILGKTIGEGTFGKVKLGTHILTGEKVAVKILEKERIVDVADVERVAREIHILKLVQHPHVIQLYEIIETPRQLYLIMEYCSGGELFDHIVASGRVREREACRFFHQIIAGVEQIHRMSVVHRDLKPENLLLDDQRNIKIVDFGLSNTFQDGQLLKTACGSPCYAAPEMIAGQRYVPARCDVWSCGVILFALVCGYLPFEDQNTAALYRKILNADYQAPKFISDNVRDMIAIMLTTDPELRTTIPQIRSHPWYRQIPESSHRWEGERGERVLEEDVLTQLDRFGFPREYAVKCLQLCKHNHVTTTYYLLLEKKRRASVKAIASPDAGLSEDLTAGGLPQQSQQHAEEFAAVGLGEDAEAGTERTHEQAVQELEAVAQWRGRPTQAEDCSRSPCGHDATPPPVPKLSLEAASHTPVPTAADADRAAGGLPAEGTPVQHSKAPATPEQNSARANGPNYQQWAQAGWAPPSRREALPGAHAGHGSAGEPPLSARGHERDSTASRRTATSAEPPSYPGHHQQYGVPLSARVPGGTRRSAGPDRGSSGVPTPRRRSPAAVPSYATPRGSIRSRASSVQTTPQSGNPSRATVPASRGEGGSAVVPSTGTPSGYRSRTPGKRPGGSVVSEALSAREASSAYARPGTSQSLTAPSRPTGPAAVRANEVRRRHYTACDSAPSSARGVRPGSGPSSGSSVAAAAAVAADLYGNVPGNSVGSSSVRNPGGPTPAWGSRPPTISSSVRASSASPELARLAQRGAYDSQPPVSAPPLSARESRDEAYDQPHLAPPLSAREPRDEAMRNCRGAFNVSCTTSKPPKQIMGEMIRVLAHHRVTCKQTSPFLVKCQRQGLRFEMEISHLDHMEAFHVVRFRRSAGEMGQYKELCSKILADMKI